MNVRNVALLAAVVAAAVLGAFGLAGAAHSTPAAIFYTCPPQDEAGFPLGQSNTSSSPIFCSYPAFAGEDPDDFFCTYNFTTGALVTDNDAGFCPPNAVQNGSGGPASPTISTTPSGTIGLGGSVSDSASLTGASGLTGAGTVTFNLYGPSQTPTCNGSAVYSHVVGSVSTSGPFASGSFTPTAAGTYYWTATFSGDANNNATASNCGTESVVVSPPSLASPSISTTPSGTISLGGSVSDSASLTGASGLTGAGTVTFNLYGPSQVPTCSGSAVYSHVVGSVSTSGPFASGSFTPTAPGTYYWTAVFSGDANNNATASNCGAESVVVSQASPSIATTPSGTVGLGGSVSDSASLTGASGVTGTGAVTFQLFGPSATANCSGSPLYSHTVTGVSTSGPFASGSFTPTAAGTYYWTVAFSGDANNNPAASSCGAESVVVSQASPSLSTTPSGTVGLGGSVSDSASLTGVSGLTGAGTMTFKLFGPSATATCSGSPLYTQVDSSVSTAGPYGSGSFTPTTAGTYYWTATFSGDANNTSAVSSCGTESVVVSKVSPSISTTPSGTVGLGGPVSDSASLTGASGLTGAGTVTFKLFGPSAAASCGGTAVYTQVDGSVSTSGPFGSGSFTPTAAGTYYWTATFSGDANNNSAASSCGAESVVVSKAKPTLGTTASANVPLGGSVSDTASLSGGFAPTGTIVFRLYGPGDANCSSSAVATFTSTVTGNGSYQSGNATPSAPGTYRWIASYSGDANNLAAAGSCGDTGESVTVSQAHPTLSTIASPNVTLGGAVSDTATLSGGFTPTGTITFRLYGPNDANCSTSPVATSTVTVSGNGSYTSANATPFFPGTYRWVASYSGDANNVAVVSPCGAANESITLSTTKASPSLTTNASGNVPFGGSVSDAATLTGGNVPTGTITFKLYGPGNTTCSGTPAATLTVSVNGNGTYSSGSFRPTNAGTYRWVASYSGDSSNNAFAAPCGAANESVNVGPILLGG